MTSQFFAAFSSAQFRRRGFARAGLKGEDGLRQVFGQKKIFCEFYKNVISRGNPMRKIDCAHSRSMKMLPWPWFRENVDFYDIFILLLGLEIFPISYLPRWCSDKSTAYWSQSSRFESRLELNFFAQKSPFFQKRPKIIFFLSKIFFSRRCARHVLGTCAGTRASVAYVPTSTCDVPMGTCAGTRHR